MWAYILKRLMLMVGTLLGIVVLTFIITRLAPGDPATLQAQQVFTGGGGGSGQAASLDSLIRQNRVIYGLDKPLLLNLNFEERTWFVRGQIEATINGETDFDRKFARRQLLDMTSAATVELIPWIEEVAQEMDEATLADPPHEYDDVMAGLSGSTTSQKLELSEIEITQLFDILLSFADETSSYNIPGDHYTISRQKHLERLEYTLTLLPVGDSAEKEIISALREDSPPLFAMMVSSGGGLMTPVLRDGYHAADTLDERALFLRMMSETERKPAWRIRAREAKNWLEARRDRRGAELPADFEYRERIPEDWNGAPSPEELKSFERAECLPMLTEAWMLAWRKGEREALRGSINGAMATEQAQEMLGRLSADDYLDELLDDKERAVERWWRRAKFQYLNYGPMAHGWHAITNTQFGIWIGKILRFDFDDSLKHNRPVLDLIKERLPVTLLLSFASIFLSYLIAIPVGIYSAVRRETFTDKTATIVLFMLYSLPSFWVANMLILFTTGGDWYDLFDAVGIGDPALRWSWTDWDVARVYLIDRARHLALPVFCMTYASFAFLSRQMRSAMLETIRQDYIRTARAKGLAEKAVVFRHALRNSLIPILTLSATLLPQLIGGSVIIEQIFSIKGMGLLGYEALLNRDYAIINAIALFTAALTLLGILLADLAYALTDPRITFE